MQRNVKRRLTVITLLIVSIGLASYMLLFQIDNTQQYNGQAINSTIEKPLITVVYDRFSVRPFRPPNHNPLENMIEEDLGIDMQMKVVVGGYLDWISKFNALAARNQLPDLVMLERSDLIRFAQEGTIIPLDELLSKAPALKNRINNWSFSIVNEHIYGIPFINPNGPYTALYIREDWLEKLGLPMPTTTDELFDVLYAFTFHDPDGNGKDDTYGFSAENVSVAALSPIGNAFGLPQLGYTQEGIPEDWIDAQGNLHFGPISKQYKHYLQYMHRLYEAKVMDPDIGSNSIGTLQNKVVQGHVGIIPMFNPQQNIFHGRSWYEEIKRTDPNAKWVYLPPIHGPDGHYGNNADSPSSKYSVAITNNVLHEPGKAEKIIELLDYMYKDGFAGGKGGLYGDIGIEGVHHVKEKDKVVQLLPQLLEDQNSYLIPYGMGGVTSHPDIIMLQSKQEDQTTFERINMDRSRGNLIVNYYYDALPFEYDGDRYIQETSIKFIYGKINFSEWEEYVRRLNEEYYYSRVQEVRKKELVDKKLLSPEKKE